MKTMKDIGKIVNSFEAFLVGMVISQVGIQYGIHELKEHYEHPRFCREYGWLADEPREVQVAYAKKLNRVGQDSWWDIQPYLKEYSAKCFLEELDQCAVEQCKD